MTVTFSAAAAALIACVTSGWGSAVERSRPQALSLFGYFAAQSTALSFGQGVSSSVSTLVPPAEASDRSAPDPSPCRRGVTAPVHTRRVGTRRDDEFGFQLQD